MFFFIVDDSDATEVQVYAAATQQDAHQHAVHQGLLIENWERVDLPEWIKVSDRPSADQLADWVAPLTVDDVVVRKPGTHPGGNAWWIEPVANVHRPVYASGTVTLGDYGLDDWFADADVIGPAQIEGLIDRFQARVEEIIEERVIDPDVTRSPDPSTETSGPGWLDGILEKVLDESHEWVAGGWQVSSYALPDSERTSAADYMPDLEIIAWRPFGAGKSEMISVVKNRRAQGAHDITVTQLQGSAHAFEINLSDYIEGWGQGGCGD